VIELDERGTKLAREIKDRLIIGLISLKLLSMNSILLTTIPSNSLFGARRFSALLPHQRSVGDKAREPAASTGDYF
jgi:hypothetical protein